MKKRRILALSLVALASAVVLAACDRHSSAHKDIKANLIDPDSAKFSEEADGKDGFVCGLVNSKNRMGGYTGNAPYIWKPGKGGLAVSETFSYYKFRRMADSLDRPSGKSEFQEFVVTCGFFDALHKSCPESISVYLKDPDDVCATYRATDHDYDETFRALDRANTK